MQVKLLVIVCLAIFCSEASAKHGRRKHKELRIVEKEKVKDELDLLAEDEAHEEKAKPLTNQIIEKEEINRIIEDPCLKKHCGPGRECNVDENGEAVCDCVKECPVEVDNRRKICSNHNETWNSDCAVYRMRCLCTKGSSECSEDKYKHVHIDYYGSCTELEECSEDEMADFPRRMREWLYNVLQDLARKKDMDKILTQLEKDSKENLSRKWINAVIWKFCDLDSHPHDRSVSRHELFPLRAPLIAMEHCIAPFLNGCDANDDHIISLVEWGKCLGLEENEIEDKCVYLRETMSSE